MKNLLFVFFVAALLTNGCSNDDNETPKVNIPITGDQVSANAIDVSWDAVEGALYYEVAITPDDENQSGMTSGLTSFSFSHLKADTEYNIMVKAGASLENENIIGEGNVTLTTEPLPAEFVGTWIYYYNDTPFEIYAFNQDGTGTYTYDGTSKDIEWTIENNQIVIETFNDNGSSYTNRYDYSFNEDQTLLTIDATIYFSGN